MSPARDRRGPFDVRRMKHVRHSLSCGAAWAARSSVLAADPTGAAASPAAPRPATSRIVAVTVYQGQALVTREVSVPEGAGTIELVVTPLPPQTVENSLYTEGADGLRVLSTRTAAVPSRRTSARRCERRRTCSRSSRARPGRCRTRPPSMRSTSSTSRSSKASRVPRWPT